MLRVLKKEPLMPIKQAVMPIKRSGSRQKRGTTESASLSYVPHLPDIFEKSTRIEKMVYPPPQKATGRPVDQCEAG